jgi:hypothetical protein
LIHSINIAALVIFVFVTATAAATAAVVADITDVIASSLNNRAIGGESGQGDREGERRSFHHGCDVTRKCGEVWRKRRWQGLEKGV